MDAALALGLGAEDLVELDRMSFRVARPMAGVTAGIRRSPRPGSSVEFSDFRAYAAGDDFRRVDWKVYARLERLVVRLYEGEEDTCISLWVDSSASMAWSPAKQACARGLAGALGYIALAAYDRVVCLTFADTVTGRTPAVRGKASAPRIWSLLATAEVGRGTSWAAVAGAARSVPRGVAVIVSDFLTESGPDRAVAALRQTGHEVVLAQVLAPEEIRPTLRGELRLVDVETRAAVEVTVDGAALAAYESELERHTADLRRTAAAHGAAFVRLDAGLPLRDLVIGPLRRAGILR